MIDNIYITAHTPLDPASSEKQIALRYPFLLTSKELTGKRLAPRNSLRLSIYLLLVYQIIMMIIVFVICSLQWLITNYIGLLHQDMSRSAFIIFLLIIGPKLVCIYKFVQDIIDESQTMILSYQIMKLRYGEEFTFTSTNLLVHLSTVHYNNKINRPQYNKINHRLHARNDDESR
jgi:hypothetical protein